MDSGTADVLQRGLEFLHRRGLPTAVDYGFMEFTANIIMFVPFGLFWFFLTPLGWRWLGPLVGVALSMLIELAQHLLLPQRVASPYDVMANGSGAMVGTLLAEGVLRLGAGRRRRQEKLRDAAVARRPLPRKRRPEG